SHSNWVERLLQLFLMMRISALLFLQLNSPFNGIVDKFVLQIHVFMSMKRLQNNSRRNSRKFFRQLKLAIRSIRVQITVLKQIKFNSIISRDTLNPVRKVQNSSSGQHAPEIKDISLNQRFSP